MAVHGGEGTGGSEKGERLQWKDFMGKINPHNTWLWKKEGPNYVSYYNQQDLEPGILKIRRLHSGRPQRPLGNGVPVLKKSTWQQRYNMEAAVWKTPGAEGRETYLLILEHGPVRQESWGDPTRKKGTKKLHLCPLPPAITTQPPVATCMVPTHTT